MVWVIGMIMFVHMYGEGLKFKGHVNGTLWQAKASFWPFNDHSFMCLCCKFEYLYGKFSKAGGEGVGVLHLH